MLRRATIGLAVLLALWSAASEAAPGPVGELAVEVRLERFVVDRPEEGSDEPYLWVLFFKVDATTADPVRPRSGSAAFYSPHAAHNVGSHGNLGGGSRDMTRGRSVAVPERLGTYADRLSLMQGLPVDFARWATRAAVVVVALEEDASPEAAVEAGRRQLERAVAAEVDAVVRGLTGPMQWGEIDSRLVDRLVRGVRQRTLPRWSDAFGFLSAGADPDDFVGVDLGMVSYGQLLGRRQFGPFTMNFEKPGVQYRITWTARRR